MKRLLLLLLLAPSAFAQTLTFNSATTVQTMNDSVAGLVVNCDFFDSICTKNLLVYGDPGFQPAIYDSFIGVASGGSSTSFSSNNSFALHTSALNGATYNDFRNVSGAWTNVCTGTITTSSGLNFTTSSCGASGGFSVGDYVQILQTFSPTTQTMWQYMGIFPQVSGGGTVTGETSDLSTVGLPAGTQKLQSIRLDSTSGSAGINIQTDTGHQNGQNQVSLTSSVTLTFTANTVTGTGTLNWEIQRLVAGGFTCSGSVSLTSTPTLFTISSCTPNETSASPQGNIEVSLTNSGNIQTDVHQVSLTEPTTQTIGLRDASYADLQNFPIRWLDGNQLPQPLTNILQPDIRGVQPYIYSENCGGGNPEWQCPNQPAVTLPMALAIQEQTHKSLWYNVPVGLGATDGATIAQFINGSTGTTGGALRAAQGHSAGYLANFTNGADLTIENGNENWNCTSTGDKLCMISALGTSEYTPYCANTNTFFGGFVGDASFNGSLEHRAIGAQTSGGSSTFAMDACVKTGTGFISSATVDVISQAPYTIFGITTGGMNSATPMTAQQQSAYANAYANANVSTQPLAYMVNTSGYPQKVRIYEENNGYTGFNVSGGFPTQAQLNGWPEGIAYAHVDGIQMLESCAILGVCAPQNEFTFEQYQQKFNGGALSNKIWGIKIGSGAQKNNNPRPAYQELLLLNQSIPAQATMIGKTWTSNPTVSFTGVNQVPTIASLPLLYGYGFKSGTNRTYVIYNTDTSTHAITLSGIDAVGTMTQTVLASANITDNNESSLVVAPVVSSVAVPTSYTAPANSMTILTGSTIAATTGTIIKGSKITGSVIH